MKKVIACLVMVFTLLGCSLTSFADNFSSGVDVELPMISDAIIDAVNELYGNSGVKISSKELDYSKGYKVYVDNNIFELSTNDADEIKQTLEDGNFIYLLPIETEKGTIVVNIQRGLPLSDNAKTVLSNSEQQEVLDNVGKWFVSSLSFYENGNLNYDYERTLLNIVGEIPKGTMLVGSLPMFKDVVAIIPNEEGVIEKIVTLTNTVPEKELSGYSRESSKIFDYEQIKTDIKDLPKKDTNMAGEIGEGISQKNYNKGIINGILILIVLCGAIILYFKKKKNSV